MVTETFVYWFTRLNHLHHFAGGLTFLLGLIALASGIGIIVCYSIKCVASTETPTSYQPQEALDKTVNTMQVVYKKLSKIFIICAISCVSMNATMTFVPTTKEMAAIYVIPKIANNEQLQNIGNEIMELATEWLKELHPSEIKKSNNTDANS